MASQTGEDAAVAANEDPRVRYDLTAKLAGNMDLHMLFPIIVWLQEQDFYDKVELVEATLQYLSATRMSDYYLEVAEENPEASAEAAEDMKVKHDETVQLIDELEEGCGELLRILRDEEALQELVSAGNFNLQYLRDEMGVTEEMVDAFYSYGKVLYEVGNYQGSVYVLSYFRELAGEHELAIKALWGKLCGEMLTLSTRESVVTALKDLLALQTHIDSSADTQGAAGAQDLTATQHLELLAFRSWLLTWSLFIFFKNPVEADEEDTPDVGSEYPPAEEMPEYLLLQMLDFFMGQKHLNAMQTNCPWLLRYVCVAMVCTAKKSRKYKGWLINVVQQEAYEFSDPITRFITALYIEYDFEKANACLKESIPVLQSDFFLHPFAQQFVDAARLAIIESVCRIHTKLDTNTLASSIDLDASMDSEQWIVDLIRDIKLDAKLDSEQHCIVMSSHVPEIHQMVIDKTKDLAYRTFQLTNEVQQLANQKEQQQ
ncbi:Eukaryotic translation initiation factor 3 subunit E [Hondaea fermentalgiana]|uniref:Eukaryotic translation initiation factor 3 subunit E n=1 Tax=Hondaea fermentalgiana TaxID=2315210 RepID=A0A2R5GG38_9STRA|nr:Eukaryotic translation initiation factor 3 subunit E [Hondaea fermentalgiana]|eukprot:GBG29565.1 Eukaryotic translation initiation factor 3 subunit E [Hondaea fermentalgiana]